MLLSHFVFCRTIGHISANCSRPYLRSVTIAEQRQMNAFLDSKQLIIIKNIPSVRVPDDFQQFALNNGIVGNEIVLLYLPQGMTYASLDWQSKGYAFLGVKTSYAAHCIQALNDIPYGRKKVHAELSDKGFRAFALGLWNRCQNWDCDPKYLPYFSEDLCTILRRLPHS